MPRLAYLSLPLVASLGFVAACSAHHAVVREPDDAVVFVPVGAAPPYTGYSRGTMDPTLDSPAMSTGLDRVDLQGLLHDNLSALRASAVMQTWEADASNGPGDAIAVLAFDNRSGLPIDGQLDALLSETETWLVTGHAGTIVAHDRQDQMIDEVRAQQSDAFNPARVAAYGQQVGARYFVTGKVQANDEAAAGAERVQYTLSMQVLDAQTGGVLWQHTSHVTKLHA